jgi:putative oxidoreductase
VNIGLLLLHVFAGAALTAHALQKLLVFRIGGTAVYLESVGFRAPSLMALAVIGTELAGGVLLGLGLLMPVGAALAASTMLVAARTDHRGKGWFITASGAEFVATNAVVALALAAVGGGRYSLDRARASRRARRGAVPGP